eukprot:2680048-Rhodomonas_salina.1
MPGTDGEYQGFDVGAICYERRTGLTRTTQGVAATSVLGMILRRGAESGGHSLPGTDAGYAPTRSSMTQRRTCTTTAPMTLPSAIATGAVMTPTDTDPQVQPAAAPPGRPCRAHPEPAQA